jgi:subtilisin-like proprotein convertase family protein
MRTGSSSILSQGRGGRSRLDGRLAKARKSRYQLIHMEGLESRTLLATTPAASAFGSLMDLSGLSSVTTSGNANSPTVAIDPYDSTKLFAVWDVDLSSITPTPPHTTSIVEGAYSNDSGNSWHPIGVSFPELDPLTVNATPPTAYTQVTDPSVAFDSKGDVYVLALQSTGAADGAVVLTNFTFGGQTPNIVAQQNIYQWVTGSDAATTPTLAVDPGNFPSNINGPSGLTQDPFVNNVYVAWASIDTEPANPNPYAGVGFNPDRAEIVVGTPVAVQSTVNEEALAFSPVTTVNLGGNFGAQRNGHPQIVISPGNATTPGQVTMAWEDFGSGATASPPVTILESSFVTPGNAYGFLNTGGFIQPAQSVTASSTQGDWLAEGPFDAGPDPTVAEDPTSPAIGDVNGDGKLDIVVADTSSNNSSDSAMGVLINQGGGVFPAAGIPNTGLFRAGPNPTSVVLGDLVAGHTTSTILDAAVANDNTPAGGVSILPNGTPPTDGLGVFGTPNSINTVPAQSGTSTVVSGFFDGSSTLSLVAVNSASNSISIFPDGSSAAASFISTGALSPISVVEASFTGGLPDLAVLYSNGTVQFFVNTSPAPGNIQFTPGQIIGAGISAISAAPLFGGLPDLPAVTSTGAVEAFQNISTAGGSAITFNPIANQIGTVIGTPVAVKAGVLSTKGNYVGFQDLAVLYQAPANSAEPNESMVAVFQNVNGTFVASKVPGTGADFDAEGTDPSGLALGFVSGGAWEDIVVTNAGGRGTITVLQPTGLPTTTVTTPITTPFNDSVNVPNQGAINNLSVSVALTDLQSVQNLSLVLIAPNNSSITLVANANAAGGTALKPARGLPGGNAVGVFGYSPTTGGGTALATIFDDNATRNIFDATAAAPPTNGNSAVDTIGYFQPEFGSLQSFIAGLGGNINGTWRLEITNFSSATPGGGFLEDFSLQFSSGMSPSNPIGIDDTQVMGVIGNTGYALKPPSEPGTGIGPGLVLAADNTLGPNSPHAGRIYAAYVVYENFQDPNGHVNPTSNTDISLAFIDPASPSNPNPQWTVETIVNDDDSDADGSSSADLNSGTFGRTQFQPEIAVDQATGTLVVSWRDARDDAANARVATYIATSIDGGQTFSAQTYANPQNVATDAITGLPVVLGPLADNQSAGNPQSDAGFGYGNQMGLAVFGGKLYPIWAGNFNQSSDATGTVVGAPLNIWYQPMAIAGGPRIIDSSMGPIPLAEATSGTVSISVTFDRAIIPSSFGIGDVEVFYHDTSKSDPYVQLIVTGVHAVAGSGNTQFTITFDPTPPGKNPATFNYTGTYSYLITPDSGPGSMPISAPVWSFVGGVLQKFDPMDQNADGTPDQNAVTTAFNGVQTPGDVYAVPAPQLPPPGDVASFDGALSILQPEFGLNSNSLPLIVPGPQVLSTSVPGGDSANGNLITDGTTNSFNVTFDRPMVVNTAAAGQTPTPGSFNPADVLSIMGPAGPITGPQFFPSDVQTGQSIGAQSTLDSTVTIPSFGGTFTIADITVSLSAAFSPDADLTAVLIAPNGSQVPLFSGVGGNSSNFVNTVFDDNAETAITSGVAPFTGSFRPTGKLASLDGLTVDFKNSFGLWVPGVWTLQLTSTSPVSGTLDSWALNITPNISVAPVVASESQNGAAATQFQIGFPIQQLSGTYTVQLGPNILDTFGDALDTNQNAGLAVIRNSDQNGPTTTVKYPATDLPQPIAAPSGMTPSVVSSTITVPDNYIIQGDKTAAGASVMQVQINLSYPTDPDLTATLTHIDPNGVTLGVVTLFSNVGSGSTSANFQNTVFDDNSATPIQEGTAPFFATFDPQQSLATVFAPAPSGMNVQGTWVLTITNNSTTGGFGLFNSWSLTFQKPLPTSGLGEPGSDIFTGSFRIFTLSQVDALSSEAWTAVGPASIGEGSSVNGTDPSGRVTGLAIDPSDASGNTVYAAGASGGIWKTTDFLTTSAAGPTWIPLTDFGPTSGVNIGGITVFPRNNDPNQSIIIAATGEGDTGTPGVGFLISTNGGQTWNLYDSTDNVDSSGNLLPIESPSRDREFVGDSAFAVTVDPQPTPTGQVIIYAALSGPTGGIWRSENTGATWQLMLSGQATSVVLDPESGLVLNAATGTYVEGNLQVVYAGIRGTGIFMSPNQGQVWNEMLGGIGNPLIVDEEFGPPPNVNPVNGPTPNGAQGRIELAVPNATGNAAEDAVYEGWLYAVVSTPGGTLDGIFVTKDFGENWTEVNIPTEPNEGYQSTPAIPANDVTLGNYGVIGTAQFPQGNYNIAIATDPTDPNVIYIGGTKDGNQTGLIRINLAGIWDAHALVPFSYDANDGGKLTLSSTGPAVVPNLKNPTFPGPYLNLIRNPGDPFVNDATVEVFNYSQFTNNGAGVEWIPFDAADFTGVESFDSPVISDLASTTSFYVGELINGPGLPVSGATIVSVNNSSNSITLDSAAFGSGAFTLTGTTVGGTDYHRIVTMVDPTTGLSRLIFGNDQGIWSVLDNNGTLEFQLGASDSMPVTSRNGNLQITQFYYGAAQPSNAAAQIAGALFYGSAQDNGGPFSDPSVISNGNITWSGPGGDSSAVATDQQGNGTLYQYWWPCCGGADTDFFQVNGVGETFGLLQASGGDPTPDPQWPFGGPQAGSNFAVDPVNGQDVVISSAVGRIFTTSNAGVTWFDVGDPAVFNNPGTWSVALAYGAPDPTAASGVGNLGNFIYVGTQAGRVYVTQDGGGSGTSNNWFNISLGLDGSPVQQIITDPTRGSHDAYAVTRDGVFYLPDSILLANNPTNTADEWVNITANLPKLAYSIFGQFYNPATDPNAKTYQQAVDLSSIAADWRYSVPNSPAYTDGPPTHPVLYVAAGDAFGSGSGVFQSTDGGQNWTYFPDTSYGAVVEGGYMPHVAVTSLSLSLGNISVNTGFPTLDGPDAPNPVNRTTALNADPDTLMAATYGQGSYAINLAPLILGDTVSVSPTAPGANPGDPVFVGTPITISGTSEITQSGNATWITVEDVTDPANPVVIAGFNPANPIPVPNATNSTDAFGNFAFNFNPATYFTSNGVKTIEVFATDNAGAVGNKVFFSFNYDPATHLVFDPNGEPPATALPGANFASPLPVIVDVEDKFNNIATTYNGPVTIELDNNATGLSGTLTVDAVAGIAMFSSLMIASDGTYDLLATAPGLTTSPPSTNILIVGLATSLYIFAPPPGSVVAGAGFGFEVGGDDVFGNPTPLFTGKATVAIAANPGNSNPNGVSETVNVVGGFATFSGLTLNKVGQGYTLKVTSGTLTPVTTGGINVTSAPADQLVITAEPPSTVTAGQTFAMAVTAEDPFGNTALGFSGTVSISLAGGTLTGGGPINVTNGVAMFPNLAIDTAGKFSLVASSNPALTTMTSSSITVNPAAPFQFVWAAGGEPPASVVHNFTFGAALDLEDQFGNLETNLLATATIMLDNNPTQAELEGTTTVDLVNGVAPFASISINAVGNGYTLDATSAGITSADSTPIDVTPTPAVGFEVTEEPPASVAVATPFGFQVTAIDQFGNPDPDFTGNVTVSLAGPTTALMGTTLTVPAVLGVATFSGLSVDEVGPGYTLTASSTGVVGAVTSNSFTVIAGPATKLLVTTEPLGTVAAGSPFSFVVTAEDQYGNLATSFVGNETITLNSGPAGAKLTGTSNATASNGVATVSGLILTKAGSGYTLQIASIGLTSAVTDSITVTPLAASALVITPPLPSIVVAGSTFGLSVSAEDKFGNLATSFNSPVVVSLDHNPGSGVLSVTGGASLTEPASGGIAQFSGLALDTVGVGYTIGASSGSLISPPSNPINVTPASATTLKVYIPPPTSMTSGSQFGMAIAALDQFGNLATGYTGNVTIALLNPPGIHATLNAGPLGDLTVAAVGGVANFHAFISTGTAASNYFIQATGDGISAPVIAGPITVTPAPATHLVLISGPPALVTPGTSFGFIVAAEDDFGNIATAYAGNFVVSVPSGSGATLGGTTSVTPANGEVTFSGLTLTESSGAVALSVASTGLTGVTTNPVSVTTPAQIAFAQGSVTVNQTAGTATVQLVRSGGYEGAVSVQFATSNGTAVAGVNYTAVNQTVSFAAGLNSLSVVIPVTNTGSSSGGTVNLSLSSPGANATLGSQATATLVIQGTNVVPPPAPLVTLQNVVLVKNKKHLVTEILVGFSGGVNAAEADSTKTYELIAANKAGQFIATKKTLLKLKSAALSGNTVTLKLKSPLQLKKAVELVVNGVAPAGLQDTEGRLIDGNHDGIAGGNAVAVIKKPGTVTIDALPRGPMAVKLPASRRK